MKHLRTGATLLAAAILVACTTKPPPSDGETPRQSAAGSTAAEASATAPAQLPAAFEPGEAYEPPIEPANFSTTIDNGYFPLVPGTRWVLHGSGESEGEIDEITVLDETRTVMGVECVVVRDEVRLDGEPVEITDDWYAQDSDGNVWYFGEETAEYEDGEVVSTAGSWESGVDGAQPGIIMPATPTVGVVYRQEFYEGEAEDMGEAVELGVSRDTPAGSFDDVLVTEDWTPLEPDVRERKWYAPGVGLIGEEQITGGESAFELVEFTAP
jgi:hypothetical protein